MEEFFERNCCIRGYHLYEEVLGAAVGESLVCEREPENTSDRYAVTVRRELSWDTWLGRCHGYVRCFCNKELL